MIREKKKRLDKYKLWNYVKRHYNRQYVACKIIMYLRINKTRKKHDFHKILRCILSIDYDLQVLL